MFKLNKYLHMLILMTFTIVFIVVYLYYIVRDMKRMYGDFKKQAAEVQSLQTTVGELKNTLQMALYGSVPPAAAAISVTTVHAEALPNKHQPCSIDAESVESEDIRKLVADGDDEEVGASVGAAVGADVGVSVGGATETVDEAAAEDTPSKDEIMAMKLDQLKEVCKQYNLSIKGSRETLINRILTEKNIN